MSVPNNIIAIHFTISMTAWDNKYTKESLIQTRLTERQWTEQNAFQIFIAMNERHFEHSLLYRPSRRHRPTTKIIQTQRRIERLSFGNFITTPIPMRICFPRSSLQICHPIHSWKTDSETFISGTSPSSGNRKWKKCNINSKFRVESSPNVINSSNSYKLLYCRNSL